MKVHSKSFSSYSLLRKTIDNISDTLSNQHSSHMQCRRGCDLCCMDYSILPVEFHFILEQLKKSGFQKSISANEKVGDGCIFLQDNSCTIYNERPVICRTHGLPLLYTNEAYEWELSTCELNFRQFDYEKFTPDNTFPQDKFNSKLFMLNKEFIAEYKEKEFGEFDLVPLRKLTAQI